VQNSLSFRVFDTHRACVWLRRFLVALLVFLILIPASTRAEDAAPETVVDDEDVYLDEIIVTGSRITRKNLISTSPMTQLDAEYLDVRGITRVEDALNALPQVYPEQTAFVSQYSTGTATINLRGIGASRALVLMNGRRLPGTGGSDINQIPGALIDRIEVLTGGASATYGSDAVTGVVNFITRVNFEGLQFDYLYALYQHRNHNDVAQAALQDAGIEPPSESVSDGDTHDFSVLYGFGDGDPGNITAYATYRRIDGVTQSERDHSACALYDDGNQGWECSGSRVIAEGYFTDFGVLWFPPSDANGNPLPPWDTQPWPGPFEFNVEPGTDQFVDWSEDPINYNFAPLNYYMRPDERITFGALGHYAFGESLEVYFETHLMQYKSDAQIAESGNFYATESLYCGNPMLSAQQFELLCAQYNLTTNDWQTVWIGRRNVEGGPRTNIFEHESARGVLGARGAIGSHWSYDLFANYGESEFDDTYINELSIERLTRALDVVTDPITGEPVCTSILDESDPDCVPWNIFGTGPVTQAALDYIDLLGGFPRSEKRLQVTGFVSGDLTEYGWTMPMAEDGVRVVLGLEYRDEKLDFSPNDDAINGDFAGIDREIKPVHGNVELWEVFTEARLPIVQSRTWAELIALELGYRYSNYSTGPTTDTYKIAGGWMIKPSLRLRGSLQRAVRAGDMFELFEPANPGVWWGVDSCVGFEPISTLEACQNTGLTAAQYGTLVMSPDDDPRGFVDTIGGGNADLRPEEADTVSFGFILKPEFLPSMSLSIDLFRIELEKAIQQGNARIIFDECITTDLAEYCDKIHRDPATGWLNLGGAYIDSTLTNIALIQTSGIDALVDYGFGIGRAGDIQLGLIVTYLDELKYQEYPGSEITDCAGAYKSNCRAPSHKWAGSFRADWITPWDASISLNWRYTGKVRDLWEDIDYPIDTKAMNYLDLAAAWDVNETLTLRVGANNVLDTDPPITFSVKSALQNGNTWPSSYDPLGRYWFASASLRL
jgi:outer membrane receptor protein involved in Fe transport